MVALFLQHWPSSPKLWFLILISSWKLCLCSDEFGDECMYHGDMCAVDSENCIRRMKASSRFIRDCYSSIYYGPGMLYKTREDTEFWMDGILEEEWMESDAEYVTYTIYRKTVGRLNWDEPNSFSPLPGCCSMTLNDTCTLPKRGSNDFHYFVMPIDDDTGRFQYCIMEIEEMKGEIFYCKDDREIDCVEFINGVAQLRGLFIPLSTLTYRPKADFCFFTPPNEFVNVRNEDDWPYQLRTKGISISGAGDDIFASTEQQNLSCSLVKDTEGVNVSSLSGKYHKHGIGDFVCYFLRLPQKDGRWLSARCDKVLYDDKSRVVIPLVIGICVCAIVLVCIVIAVWLYKRHFVNFTFKKTMEELPNTLVKDELENYRFIGSGNTREETIHSTRDNPEEITSLDFNAQQEEKTDLMKESVNPPHNGGLVRYTEVVAVSEVEETPTSPSCSDSGIVLERTENDTHVNATKDTNNDNKEEDSGFSISSLRDREDSGIISPDPKAHDTQDISEMNDLRSGAYTQKKEIAFDAVNDMSKGEFLDEIGENNKHEFPLYIKKSAIDYHDADIVIHPISNGYFPKS